MGLKGLKRKRNREAVERGMLHEDQTRPDRCRECGNRLNAEGYCAECATYLCTDAYDRYFERLYDEHR